MLYLKAPGAKVRVPVQPPPPWVEYYIPLKLVHPQGTIWDDAAEPPWKVQAQEATAPSAAR